MSGEVWDSVLMQFRRLVKFTREAAQSCGSIDMS